MIFRIYHETLGGHVHMRLFAGKQEGGLGKCGDLTMRIDEFEAFRNCSLIDFRPEPAIDRTLSAHDAKGNAL